MFYIIGEIRQIYFSLLMGFVSVSKISFSSYRLDGWKTCPLEILNHDWNTLLKYLPHPEILFPFRYRGLAPFSPFCFYLHFVFVLCVTV